MKFYPGLVISCKIFSLKIERARVISITRGVVQIEWDTEHRGRVANYAFFEDRPWLDGVEEIVILNRKLADGLEVGDVVECSSRSAEATVLAVVGGGVLLSAWDDFDIAGPWYTLGELVRKGVELKKEPTRAEDKPTELTIDQIAEKFGLKPEQVRIKKETE